MCFLLLFTTPSVLCGFCRPGFAVTCGWFPFPSVTSLPTGRPALLRTVFRHGTEFGRNLGEGYFATDQLLYAGHLTLFVFGDEGVGCSVGLCAGGASDPVYVILPIVRYVVVDDQFDLVDIDTAA